MCVCVRERESKRESERESKRERGRPGMSCRRSPRTDTKMIITSKMNNGSLTRCKASPSGVPDE